MMDDIMAAVADLYGYGLERSENAVTICPWSVKDLRPGCHNVSLDAVPARHGQEWTFSTKFPGPSASNLDPETEGEVVKRIVETHQCASVLNGMLHNNETDDWGRTYGALPDDPSALLFRTRTKHGTEVICCRDHVATKKISDALSATMHIMVEPHVVVDKTAFYKIVRA